MRLQDIVRPECIEIDAAPTDKAEALRLIARLACRFPALQGIGEEAVLEGLEERESHGSTGFGKGIAIPHCRVEGLAEFVVGVVTVPGGVEFDALDEQPVNLITFIIAPEAQSNEHIRVLSTLSQALNTPGVIDEVLAARAADAVIEGLLRHRPDPLETGERKGSVLFHLLIQDESRFHELLEALVALEPRSLVVIESENTGVYLRKLPLFAGFWRDDAENFDRMILGVIEERLANEIIRRVESVTGSLDETEGVMLAMQELTYCAGSVGP